MRKAFFKDIWRTILKQKVSFVSIMIIAGLAVTAYLGINFGSAALKNNAANFYKQHNFRDFEISSTQLLSPMDLQILKEEEGVSDVEGVLQTSGKIFQGNTIESINVLSVTERINQPEILEGRLPSAANECAVEQEILEKLELKTGDRIRLTNSKNTQLDYLNGTEFLITGSVIHPDHYAKKTYVPETRYVLVTKEAFDREKLEDGVMKAVLVMDKPEGMGVFDSGYKPLKESLNQKLKTLSPGREENRSGEVRQKAEEKIQDGQKKLDEAKQQLEDGRRELDLNTEKLKDGERQLAEGKDLLDSGRQQLLSAEAELNANEIKLAAGKALLDSAAAEIEMAETELPKAKALLDYAKEQLDAGRAELDSAKAQLDDAEVLLRDGFLKAETMKTGIRDRMKEVLWEVGEAFPAMKKAIDGIQWAEPVLDPDLSDPDLSIGRFAVTDSVVLNIGGSIADLMDSFLRPLAKESGLEDQLDKILEYVQNLGIYERLNELYETKVSADMQKWESGHAEYLDGLSKYQAGEATYAEKYAEYEAGLAEYEAGLAKYESGKQQYEAGLAEYEAGLALWLSGKAQFDAGRAEFNQKLAEYEQGLRELENGREELAKGEKKYREGLAEYEEGEQKLEDAKAELENLSPCRWVILDVSGNGSFQHAENSAVNVSKLGMTFALLFVLVGALVIYVTLGRIIEEQRQLVGTQKALGFFNKEILAKYLFFGGIATLAGIILGTLMGYFGIQFAVIYVHQIFYQTPSIPRSFNGLLFIIVLIVGLILALASTGFACFRMIRQPARELMQEKMPVVKKKKYGTGQSKGNLYSRLILRNILSDKGRVAVTIISIAGCCTLLMIGFTLRAGVNNAINIQFENLYKYEMRVDFDSEVSETVQEDLEKILKDEGASYSVIYYGAAPAKINEQFGGYEIVCGNRDELKKWYVLRDYKTGEETDIPDSGVLIQHRTAETRNGNVGDTITLYDAKMDPYETTITGIVHLYFGRCIFMSEDNYQETYGKAPTKNCILLDSHGKGEALKEALSEVRGVVEITPISKLKDTFNNVGRSLTAVTIILIVAAGLMAYFILLNLINMYLSQKKRELTIMRINGYTTKEVIGYVSRESIVTTVLGIILGLGLGALMGYLILRFLEQPQAGFVHEVNLLAILLSTVITGIFSAAINSFGLRKVKNLKLTDISE